MKYLPIFGELFTSDSIVFMLMGFLFAVLIGIRMNHTRRTTIGLVSSFILYVVCELLSNVHTSYLFEILLVFVGTIALGGVVGFLTGTIVVKVKSR